MSIALITQPRDFNRKLCGEKARAASLTRAWRFSKTPFPAIQKLGSTTATYRVWHLNVEYLPESNHKVVHLVLLTLLIAENRIRERNVHKPTKYYFVSFPQKHFVLFTHQHPTLFQPPMSRYAYKQWQFYLQVASEHTPKNLRG